MQAKFFVHLWGPQLTLLNRRTPLSALFLTILSESLVNEVLPVFLAGSNSHVRLSVCASPPFFSLRSLVGDCLRRTLLRGLVLPGPSYSIRAAAASRESPFASLHFSQRVPPKSRLCSVGLCLGRLRLWRRPAHSESIRESRPDGAIRRCSECWASPGGSKRRSKFLFLLFLFLFFFFFFLRCSGRPPS